MRSRSISICRSCSDTARWPCGLVSCTLASNSAWRSKKPGVLSQVVGDVVFGDALDAHSSISPSKTVSAGPVISTRRVVAGPLDAQPPAAGVDLDRAVQPAQADAGHHRGAGAGAAGQRLAGAALVHAQRDLRARQHLHEAGVDLARKAVVHLDLAGRARPPARVDVVHALHRVRVAHRQHRHLHAGRRSAPAATARSRLRVAAPARRQSNGMCACSKSGAPMSTVTRPSSRSCSSSGGSRSRRRTAALVGQAALAHVAHEAARAVAAMLDLVAAGVEDAVAEVDARRCAADRPPGSGRHRCRSADRPARGTARCSVPAAPVASSMTKSLPAPCILVKRNLIQRLWLRHGGLRRLHIADAI